MAPINRLVLVTLEGAPPAELGLPPLKTLDRSSGLVHEALTPYLSPEAKVERVRDIHDLDALSAIGGMTVVYLIGHAWLTEGRYTCAILDQGQNRLLRGDEFLDASAHLIPPGGRGIFLIDTCHAAALGRDLPGSLGDRSSFVFASGAEDSALEFPIDRATRFSLGLVEALHRLRRIDPLDIVRLALEIGDAINAGNLVQPQSVEYWTSGPPVRISRRSDREKPPLSASRTYVVVRTILIALGVVLAAGAGTAALYYRNHVRLVLKAGDLSKAAANLAVTAWREEPGRNRSEKIRTWHLGQDTELRGELPATDLIIAVDGSYTDGAPRAIRYHLLLAPGWEPAAKYVELRVPSAAEALRHPGMAFIPRTSWLEGEKRGKAENPKPFWIDFKPVKVQEYLPYAYKGVDEEAFESYQSVLLTEIGNEAAVKATGLESAGKLINDLEAAFKVIDRAERKVASREPYTEAAASLPRIKSTCPECPAPMSLNEAKYYCAKRGKRLPSQLEWELAARGVDGRIYPWGNDWDPKRANAGLPPEVGVASRTQPSEKFLAGASPFGVLDLVGNAGDWVEVEEPSNPTFMGGSYRFDPSHCNVFDPTPDTGGVIPRFEVTCRCVAP